MLIVEDDSDITEMLGLLLPSEGFEVVRAEHGAEALQYLRSGGTLPDLILLDLMMPVMSGWEFRDRQLTDPELAKIPVIVMTGVGDWDQVLTARADAYMTKPVDFGELLATVARVVG